ncbi:MAG: hypothetical protein ABR985_10645 [Methanotrichaceae archaeon]|jgi:hypothetical protein
MAANRSGLQYTFYFPTTKDKARWKRLSKPYCLNQWIFMQVERAISGDVRDAVTTNAADVADTINQQLRTQNELLTARLQQALSEVADLRKGSAPPTMDKDVVDILKSGGVWTSQNLLKRLALSIFTTNMENLRDNKPPVDTPLDIKRVEKTLETLQDLHLVENTWKGFKWIK